jgi:hypothetical protein
VSLSVARQWLPPDKTKRGPAADFLVDKVGKVATLSLHRSHFVPPLSQGKRGTSERRKVKFTLTARSPSSLIVSLYIPRRLTPVLLLG